MENIWYCLLENYILEMLDLRMVTNRINAELNTDLLEKLDYQPPKDVSSLLVSLCFFYELTAKIEIHSHFLILICFEYRTKLFSTYLFIEVQTVQSDYQF